MAIQNNFPAISPSLSLDFANVKALDPRITFARASAATYYGTDTAKAEENLLLQSQSFSTTPWSTLRTVLTGGQTAPDGTSTAWKFQSVSGETAAPNLSQTNNVTSGLAYVVSIHAKVGDRNFVRIVETLQTGSSVLSGFDLLNGTVGSSGSGHTTSIVDVGGGWYRCVVVFTANATRSGAAQFIATESATSNTVADNEGFIELWGAQLEQRSAVTAYTPTTTQPITNYIPVLQSAAAGVARFDHDPNTFESLGLLIEESRTNLILRSEEFDNAGWSKTNSTITANTIVAPDGTLTGDKLVENTTTARHFTNQGATLTANSSVTASVYVKAAERTRVRISNANVSNWASSFLLFVDLTNGTLVSGAGTIESVGNGWYRVSGTGTFGASTASGGMIVEPVISGTTSDYTGDGFSGIFIWGAQLEAGAFPTSYIPTTTAQVTRAADSASMTGANFSSWYNAGEGTFYGESQWTTTFARNNSPLFRVDDGTNNNFLQLGFRNVSPTVPASISVRASGGSEIQPTSPTVATNDGLPHKFAGAYTAAQLRFSVDNQTAGTATPSSLPVVNIARIGSGNTGVQTLYAIYVRKLAFYPKALTAAELQSLTG